MEPILLVAHASRDRAYEALRHIARRLRPARPGAHHRRSLRPQAAAARHRQHLQRHRDRKRRRRAWPARGGSSLSRASTSCRTRSTPTSRTMACSPTSTTDGTIVVMGSLQCPFYVQKALKGAVRRRRRPRPRDPDDDRRRVRRQGRISEHARRPRRAAGAKAGRPVKMIYDRHEDMLATTKRHPARGAASHRRDAGRDDRRAGHRSRHGRRRLHHAVAVVLSRGALHATGTYRQPARPHPCAARWRPTRRRTARSAASAHRRRCSRRSCTWRKSPRPSVSMR